MSAHTPEHERLLQAVVVGDLARDDEAVREQCAECETCAAELEAVLRAAALLDEEAREEHEVLALAEELERAPGEDRVAAFRDHPEFRRPGGRRPGGLGPRILVTMAAAAAALLLAFFVGQWVKPQEPRTPQTLGGVLEALEPRGEVPGFERFRWKVDPEVAAGVRRYDLVIDAGEGPRTISGIEAIEWSDPTVTDALPESIRWWVIARGLTEEIARSEPVSASRRSP